MNSKVAISLINKEYILRQLNEGRRIDGRKLDEYRKISIEHSLISTAEGSALAQIGDTKVMVGVKMKVEVPFPDTPDSGILVTNSEFRPIASGGFESGPPQPNSIELSRVVDRGLRESGMIPRDKLVIEEGVKVWSVYVDIHIIDHVGNLFDTAFIGAVAALMHAKVPASREGLGEDYPLIVEEIPIMCTIAKLGDTLIADPNIDEELVANTRLSIALDKTGDIRAMQKGLTGTFSVEQIKEALELCSKRSVEMRDYITSI